MDSVDRLSPDFRQGPSQVSLCLPREREGREDAPASKDLRAEKHAWEFEHHNPALEKLAVAERAPRRASSQGSTISGTGTACGFSAKGAANHRADAYSHPVKWQTGHAGNRQGVEGL